jgi:hypothetical protein
MYTDTLLFCVFIMNLLFLASVFFSRTVGRTFEEVQREDEIVFTCDSLQSPGEILSLEVLTVVFVPPSTLNILSASNISASVTVSPAAPLVFKFRFLDEEATLNIGEHPAISLPNISAANFRFPDTPQTCIRAAPGPLASEPSDKAPSRKSPIWLWAAVGAGTLGMLTLVYVCLRRRRVGEVLRASPPLEEGSEKPREMLTEAEQQTLLKEWLTLLQYKKRVMKSYRGG